MENHCEKKTRNATYAQDGSITKCLKPKINCSGCKTGDSTYCLEHSDFIKEVNGMPYCEECIKRGVPTELGTMTLINFHKFSKNRMFVREVIECVDDIKQIYIECKRPCKFIITVLSESNTEHKLYVKKSMIEQLKIKSKSEADEDFIIDVGIKGICNFDKKGYFPMSACNYDDATHLYVSGVKFTVTDITCKWCKNPDFVDPKEFNDVEQYAELLEELETVPFKYFVKHFSPDNDYYIVTEKAFIPFHVSKIDYNGETHEYITTANVCIGGNNIDVEMTIFWAVNAIDERYIEFTVKIEELNYGEQHLYKQFIIKE